MDPRTGLSWLHEGLDGNVGQFAFRGGAPIMTRFSTRDVNVYETPLRSPRSAQANAFQAPARAGVPVPQFVKVQVQAEGFIAAEGMVSMANFSRAMRYLYARPGQPILFVPGMQFGTPGEPPPIVLEVSRAQLPEVLRLLGLQQIQG